jgi:hydroxylamine reductase
MYSDFLKIAATVGGLDRISRRGETLAGLEELVINGLKGACCYLRDGIAATDEGGKPIEVEFARALIEALAAVADGNRDEGQLIDLSLQVGRATESVLRGVASARARLLGAPSPVKVSTGHVQGKAILVSGHDLFALKAVLQATEGQGINVYTHGEMLTAHAYSGLSAHKHLVGHFGGSWQNQASDFDAFPGAILVTTNCLQRPLQSYRRRMFTTGAVAWPGVTHLENNYWGPLLRAAKEEKGFTTTSLGTPRLTAAGTDTIARQSAQIAAELRAGKWRHIYVVGGCDGTTTRRGLFREFVDRLPGDALVWTFACGKFRMDIAPADHATLWNRVMDIGQCADLLAITDGIDALAKASGATVKDLPVSFVLSWYEQKALAYVLVLLSRGVHGMRLGPTMPAFLTPQALDLFRERFGLQSFNQSNASQASA